MSVKYARFLIVIDHNTFVNREMTEGAMHFLSTYTCVGTHFSSVDAFELEDNNSGSVGACLNSRMATFPSLLIVQIILSDVTTEPVIDSLFWNFNLPPHCFLSTSSRVYVPTFFWDDTRHTGAVS